MITYIIGLTGNLLFGFKSLFQVIHCYKSRTTKGISTAMIVTDFLGNICCALFIYQTTGFNLWPQFINYFFATLWLIVLIIMKIVFNGEIKSAKTNKSNK